MLSHLLSDDLGAIDIGMDAVSRKKLRIVPHSIIEVNQFELVCLGNITNRRDDTIGDDRVSYLPTSLLRRNWETKDDFRFRDDGVERVNHGLIRAPEGISVPLTKFAVIGT